MSRVRVGRRQRSLLAVGLCLFLALRVLAEGGASGGSGAVTTTVAGTSVPGFAGEGGVGTAAQLNAPAGLASGTGGGPASSAGQPTGGSDRGLLATITTVAVTGLDVTAFPMVLLLLVLGFLAIQDRLDRRDPKLALAPVHDDSELDFTDKPRGVWSSRRGHPQEHSHG